MFPPSSPIRIAAIATLFAASPLVAQTVSPPEFAKAEAPSFDTKPFGAVSASGWRFQQIHENLSAMSLRSLLLRRDVASLSHYMGFSAEVVMRVSTARTTVATMETNFNGNHGSNVQTVIASRRVSFPATGSGHAPAAFAYELKFDRPYAFDGKGPLCWEATVRGQDNLLTSVSFDAAFRANTNPRLAITTFGVGCSHSRRVGRMTMSARSSMNWPNKIGSVGLTISDLPPVSVGIAAVGFSRKSAGVLPLPFTFPGSQTAASGPCTLYTSLDFLFAFASDTRGRGTTNIALPATTNLNGFQMRAQVLAADRDSENAFNFVASNAVEMNWVAPYEVPNVGQVAATSFVAATGAVRKNFGLVIGLK